MKLAKYFSVLVVLFFCAYSSLAQSIFFPKQQLSFGFYSKSLIGADPWRPPSPLFWDSTNKATSGGTIVYTRMLYHTQKYFSAEWGVSAGAWYLQPDTIVTLSALIQLRWWIFRTDWFNPYLVYSVAGPTLLSRHKFGPSNLSANFIFQDYLGLGVVFGKQHHFDLSARMYHYSNGDLFTHNDGFDVPLIIFFGFSF